MHRYAYVTLACQLSRIRKTDPALFDSDRQRKQSSLPTASSRQLLAPAATNRPLVPESKTPNRLGSGLNEQLLSDQYNEEVERSLRGEGDQHHDELSSPSGT